MSPLFKLMILAVVIGTGACLHSSGAVAQEPQAVDHMNDRVLDQPEAVAADTLRTNIWLTEALMSEIARRSVRSLPPGPAAVRLVSGGTGDADQLLHEAMVRILGGMGHELFLPDDDEARQGAADYQVNYEVVGIDLKYPDVGRTLGIWRQWVARELTVTAKVEVSAVDSGRLFFSDRITRSYSDRLASSDFDHVDSNLYDFTTAETAESGWQSRLEEMVVLSTLAGLVVIYFANTTD